MKPIFGWTVALLAAVTGGNVQAVETPPPCEPVWEDGWIRLTPAPMAMLGGFGRLRNACSQPVTVASASSPSFAEVSLHETRMVDGVSQMREVEHLPVGPGEELLMQPGGLHLMLMQPVKTLEEGDIVSIDLRLDDGRTVRGQLQARRVAP